MSGKAGGSFCTHVNSLQLLKDGGLSYFTTNDRRADIIPVTHSQLKPKCQFLLGAAMLDDWRLSH